jgi:hypothetical protein
MQVFIIGSVWDTFKILDKRRLRKQLIECKQILAVYNGTSQSWKNHPIVKSYRPYQKWLTIYTWMLEEFLQEKSDFLMLMNYNKWLKEHAPKFHTEAYFNQMKRRLYTKDKAFYEGFKHLGESFINWYYVDGEWLYYKDGKKVKNEK